MLTDLDRGSLLEAVFDLPLVFVVPDLLYERELRPYGGARLLERGLQVAELDGDGVIRAINFRRKRPSCANTERSCRRVLRSLPGRGGRRFSDGGPDPLGRRFDLTVTDVRIAQGIRSWAYPSRRETTGQIMHGLLAVLPPIAVDFRLAQDDRQDGARAIRSVRRRVQTGQPALHFGMGDFANGTVAKTNDRRQEWVSA